MSNPSDSGPEAIDAETHALLARLYDDLGEHEAESAPASVGSASEGAEKGLVDEEELADFQNLRSLFSQLPDEEPSDALSNKLLALAAEHAPTPKEEGFFSWLSGLFAPMASHPGLAAAASLVLVAGVAGTFYATKTDTRVHPTAPSSAVAPSDSTLDPTAAEPATREAADLEAAVEEEIGQPATADEGAAVDSFGEANAARGGGGYGYDDLNNQSAPGATKASKQKRERRGASSAPSSLRERQGTGRSRRSTTSSSSKSSATEGRVLKDIVEGPNMDGAFAEERERAQEQKAFAPKPAPAPNKAPSPSPGAPEEDADDREAKRDSNDKEKSADAPSGDVNRLLTLAKIAARKGECGRVRVLAKQVRSADSAFYDRSFLADGDIRRCMGAK